MDIFKEKKVKPAVVVPVYKLQLNCYEEISLNRHLSVLEDYDRYLLIPNGLTEEVQELIVARYPDDPRIFLHAVDNFWLKSVDSYNQLMLNRDFYQFYQSYTHILIAQLDAYTFSDQMLKWCQSELDYIGGPIYQFGVQWELCSFCSMGQGGFSLRKIDSFIKALQLNPVIFTWRDLIDQLEPFNLNGKTIRLLRFFICWLRRSNRLKDGSNELAKWVGVNEDLCFGKYLPSALKSFRVGGYDQSVAFCIDGNVDYQLTLLNECLPFGAHAWWTLKSNLLSWTPYIDELHS